MPLPHRNQNPFHIICYLLLALSDAKIFFCFINVILLSPLKLLFNHILLIAFSLFFPLTSTIPESTSFSTSFLTPYNTNYIFPFLKTKFGGAFLFFSPNNFLLFALASHNECCVKFVPLSFPQHVFSSLNYAINFPPLEVLFFTITLFHPLLFPCPHYSSLSTYFPFSNCTEFVPFYISSLIPQSNLSPTSRRLYEQLLLIYWVNT